MSFLIGILLGFKEIWANKFRSLLTMVGIVLGVAALVGMIGIIRGYFNSTEEWIIESGGMEKVSIYVDSPPEEQQHLADISPGRTLLDARAIRKTCNLAAFVSPEVNLRNTLLQRKDKRHRISTVGAQSDILAVNNLELSEGRFVGDLDLECFARVVVLGSDPVKHLFEPNEKVLGETIKINGLTFTVVGLLKHYEKNFGKRNHLNWKNRVAIIPITTMMKRFTGNEKLTWLNVEVSDVNYLDELVEQLENVLHQTHRGIDDFRIQTRQEMMERFNESKKVITLAMSSVAAISLLIGGIGIMNVMLASINERIREIGTRKAVGARGLDIFAQFIAEAIALSLLGGLVGLLAAAGLIRILTAVFAAVELVPELSADALAIGFVFSVSMGLISGIYPAIKASRLDPIEALRYE